MKDKLETIIEKFLHFLKTGRVRDIRIKESMTNPEFVEQINTGKERIATEAETKIKCQEACKDICDTLGIISDDINPSLALGAAIVQTYFYRKIQKKNSLIKLLLPFKTILKDQLQEAGVHFFDPVSPYLAYLRKGVIPHLRKEDLISDTPQNISLFKVEDPSEPKLFYKAEESHKHKFICGVRICCDELFTQITTLSDKSVSFLEEVSIPEPSIYSGVSGPISGEDVQYFVSDSQAYLMGEVLPYFCQAESFAGLGLYSHLDEWDILLTERNRDYGSLDLFWAFWNPYSIPPAEFIPMGISEMVGNDPAAILELIKRSGADTSTIIAVRQEERAICYEPITPINMIIPSFIDGIARRQHGRYRRILREECYY